MAEGTVEGAEILGVRIRNAIAHGCGWVAKHQEKGGGFAACADELRAHYKAPLMFVGAGHIEEGLRCISHIRRKLRNAQGELCSRGGDVKSGFARFARNFANYMDGWVAIGAWLLGEYGFADEICARLLETRSPSNNAVPTGPEKWVGALRYDVLTNASIGRAFLITGRRDEALAIADFLSELVGDQHQRDLDSELQMTFDNDWRPVEPLDSSERPYYRFVLGERGERVFCPAFACSFLCEAHEVSKRVAYLDAARLYLRFVTSSIEFREGTLANGKSGWAAGMLALATGDWEAADAARQIAARVLERQTEEGEFASRRREQSIPLARRLETTAEQTVWCTQYLRMHALGLWGAAQGGGNHE